MLKRLQEHVDVEEASRKMQGMIKERVMRGKMMEKGLTKERLMMEETSLGSVMDYSSF